MARKPATADNITVGSTVFTSRSGRKSYVVESFEVEAAYPDYPPIVYVISEQANGLWFAMHELWT